MNKTLKLIAILCIILWLGACVYTVIKCISNINNKTCIVKNDNTRDYYLDVLVETDKFQSYINEHGKWWTK